jgi:hypothetical protein
MSTLDDPARPAAARPAASRSGSAQSVEPHIESYRSVLVDLTEVPLRELLLDGDSPLDRVAQAVVDGLRTEVYAAFQSASRV